MSSPDITSNVNVIVDPIPINVTAVQAITSITVAEQGVQGPQGIQGPAGGGSAGGNLVTGFSTTGYLGTTGALLISGVGIVQVTQTGQQLVFSSSLNTGQFYPASNPNQFISTGQGDIRYLLSGSSGSFYLTSNPSNYITTANLNGLGTTGSFDLRYLQTGLSGELYKVNNPLNFIKSGDVDTKLIGLADSGNFISGISITGGLAIQNSFNINAGSNITLTQQGLNTLQISSSASAGSSYAGVTGMIFSGSGIVVSGNILLTGAGNVSVFNSGNTVYISGNTGYLLSYYQVSNPNNYVSTGSADLRYMASGGSGSLSDRITTTGATLLTLINASSAGVSSINGASGVLNILGNNNIYVTTAAQNITISTASSLITGLMISGSGSSQTGQIFLTGAGNVNLTLISGVIYISGNTGYLLSYYTNSNPLNFSSSGNVETTGTNIINLLNGLSGQFNISGGNLNNLINGVSGQLNISGGNLNSRINTLYNANYLTGIMLSGSGQSFTGQIFITGAGNVSIWNSGQLIFISGNTGYLLSYYNNSNPLNFSSSGNVETTGTQNFSLLKGLSGQLDLTGNNLLSKINTEINSPRITGVMLSGSGQSFTGQIFLTGAGNISLWNSGQLIFVSGNTGYLLSYYNNSNSLNFSSSGNVETTGTQNVSLLKGLSGQLDLTGNNLLSKINTEINSTRITGVMLSGSGQSFTGQIFLTGAGNVSLWNSGQLIFISGNTGYLLSYYNNSNPLNFSSSGNVETTGTNIVSIINNLSGQFNISGGNLNSLINGLSGQLNITGGNLTNRINTLYNGNYITGIMLSGSGQSFTGQVFLTGAGNISLWNSGQLIFVSGNTGYLLSYYNNSNPLNFSSSGNVETTGTQSFSLLKGLSGQLDLTGSNLLSKINTEINSSRITGLMLSGSGQAFTGQIFLTGVGNISLWNSGQLLFISGNTGYLLSYYNNSNPLNFSSSGNVETTGTNIISLLNGLSGQLNITGGNLNNKINTEINSSRITGLMLSGSGQAFTGQIFLTGAGNISLWNSGQLIFVSGNTGFLSSYYSILNPANYASSGNFISGVSISGSVGIQGALNINAGSNITLTQQGINTVQIASSAGGGSSTNGVTGVSITGGISISGAIGITGMGSISVFQAGNSIQVSGSLTNIITGNLPVIFDIYDIPNGIKDTAFIQFTQDLGRTPTLIGELTNNSGNTVLSHQVSGLSRTGFYLNLSASTPSNNYSYRYMATTGSGYLNFGISQSSPIAVTGLSITGAVGMTGAISLSPGSNIYLNQLGINGLQISLTGAKGYIHLPVQSVKLPNSSGSFPARIDASNLNWELLFAATGGGGSQSGLWQFSCPNDFNSGITPNLYLNFTMKTPQTGINNLSFRASVLSLAPFSTTNINNTSFASPNTGTLTLTNNLSGNFLQQLIIPLSSTSGMNTGATVLLQLDRNIQNITTGASGDCALQSLMMEYTKI